MGVHFDRGQFLYHATRFASAADEFRSELAEDPHCGPTRVMLALSLSKLGDDAGAYEVLTEAVRLDPNQSNTHFTMASILISYRPPNLGPAAGASKYIPARDAVNRAIALRPGDADYFALLAALEELMNRYEAGLAAAASGLESNPQHARCLVVRARCLVALNRLDEAAETAAQAVRAAPQDADAHAVRGQVLAKQKRHAEAADHLAESLRLNPAQPSLAEDLSRERAKSAATPQSKKQRIPSFGRKKRKPSDAE